MYVCMYSYMYECMYYRYGLRKYLSIWQISQSPIVKNASSEHVVQELNDRICPTGSTPKGGPTESSPSTQAARHPGPRLSRTFVRSVPSPVLNIWYLSAILTLVDTVFAFYSHRQVLNTDSDVETLKYIHLFFVVRHWQYHRVLIEMTE